MGCSTRHLSVVLAASLLTACGDSRPAPSAPSAPTPAAVVRLTIAGPATVDLRDRFNLTATALYSDGTSSVVTNVATWSSSAPAVVWISGGRADALSIGQADVRATIEGAVAVLSVTVDKRFLPGPFSLRGAIYEAKSFAGLPGAVVEVREGPDAGRTARTDSAGSFAFTGLTGGLVVLRATKPNYYSADVEVLLDGDKGLNVVSLRRQDEAEKPSGYASSLVFNQIRTRGPNGSADEFFELRNLSQYGVDPSKLSIVFSDDRGVTRQISLFYGYSQTIKPGCAVLFVNGGPGGYGERVRADGLFTGDLADGGGMALLDAGGRIVDAVGFSGGSAFREGNPVEPVQPDNIDRSYIRNGPDTDDNRTNFRILVPSAPVNSSAGCGS